MHSKHHRMTRKIFITGGRMSPVFIRYMGSLTGKSQPKICYLPTASADDPIRINEWYRQCVIAGVTPFVQPMFISSYTQKQSFEEVLLGMDGIYVSGGNTLNMLAIWKAHGIDSILQRAWDKGIVLSGGSAGGLCWFQHGTTDSRPMEITRIDCLGFINASHCPHYDSEETRRPRYHAYIQSGEFKAGYACDDDAGIFFEDNAVSNVVSLRKESNAYYVYEKDGRVYEDVLPKTLLV